MIGALGEGMLTIADGPEMPSINDFLPDPFVFQGTPFAINRIILVRILATVIMMLVLGITASRAKLIPGRWQGAVEWLIEFVRDNIVYQVMGELRGKRYVPMITTVFCTLLIFNLCGIIPGFNIAASASITLPLVFAMWCFCQYWIAGIREKGLGHFLRDEIFPKGVPAPIDPQPRRSSCREPPDSRRLRRLRHRPRHSPTRQPDSNRWNVPPHATMR